MSIEDRFKLWFVPGRIYYPHKIQTELAAGEPELAILNHLIADAGGMAVDVGANRGIYSFALSRLCGRVLAFEPNPDLAAFARRKLPSNVQVQEVALGATEDRRSLHIPHDRKGKELHLVASLVPNDEEGRAHQVPVTVRTLDSFNPKNVQFIKVDVEGSEFDVLKGAARTIERDRPVLLIELLAGHYNDPPERIRTICRLYGYEACIMGNDGILRSVDATEGNSSSRNVIFAIQEQLRAWSEIGICEYTS